MLVSKAEGTARFILKEFGINTVESLATIQLKDLIQARGAFYEEAEMDGKDGRIVTLQNRSIITINSSISDAGKKRFAAAHELGHFELHKDLSVTADTQYELCTWFQTGSKEKEANDFASELLMPAKLFQQQCIGKKFGPKLIEKLSEDFTVSRTAAILKFVKAGNHPVCVFCSKGNKVAWWKMSEEMEAMDHVIKPGWRRYLVKMSPKFPPPPDSVAGQLMLANGRRLGIETFQQIEKSTWFSTIPEDDPPMFEYCNYIPAYDFALSIVWED